MRRRRRDLLLGATAAVATAGALPAPAVAQGKKELTMVTSWPAGSPGWWTSALRLAESIAAMSDGWIKIIVHSANELVGAFETFDAVSAGVADMYHSADNYFGNKVPALDIICSTPYGMAADELSSWLAFGGGQALWDEVDAPLNVKPLAACNTGVQMGGWFIKEVNSPADFKGLALSHAGSRRRGPAPHGGHRRDDPCSRDNYGTQIGRDRRERVGRPVARHRARAR